MNSTLKTFPQCIQVDICLHLNRELLKNCSVFENASEGRYCSKCFFLLIYANKFDISSLVTLRALALLFMSIYVPPGYTLIHQGNHSCLRS